MRYMLLRITQCFARRMFCLHGHSLANEWRIQDFTRGLGVRQPIIWHNVCRKLHKNERNWTENGDASLARRWIRQCKCLLHKLYFEHGSD